MMFKSSKWLLVLAICLVSQADMLWAQSSGRKSLKLAAVTVEGNKTADANFIKLNSGLTANEQVTGEDIQKAIKQLWSLRMFSDIQVILEKEVSGAVFLKIKVEEYPRLERIELEGNKKIKKKDLEKALNFYKGQVISPQEIKKAQRKIKKLYADKGYLLASIEPKTKEGALKDRIIMEQLDSS